MTDKTNPATDDLDLSAVDFGEFEITVLPDKSRPVTECPPENILKLAQASWDARKRHSISLRGNVALARKVEAALKTAGDFTTPPTSMSVVRPDDGVVIFYRAGERRGRKTGDKPADTSTAGK